MKGREKKPNVKKKKPYCPTCPRHLRPTASVESTRQQIPMPDRANPLEKRRRAYAQMFGEKEVRKEVMEDKRHDRSTVFFLPKYASAIHP